MGRGKIKIHTCASIITSYMYVRLASVLSTGYSSKATTRTGNSKTNRTREFSLNTLDHIRSRRGA